jgi:hypothetical protein
VVLPAPTRVQFLRTWLPYIREMKPLLESRMYSEIWENMEGSIVSFALALPSNDQAEIIVEWVNGSDQLRYLDLSEAFEIWCYRAKTSVLKSCSRVKARHDTKRHESDTARHVCVSVPARHVSRVVFLNVA